MLADLKEKVDSLEAAHGMSGKDRQQGLLVMPIDNRDIKVEAAGGGLMSPREGYGFGSIATKLAKKTARNLGNKIQDINITNSKEYKNIVKELTTDNAQGAGVVYTKADLEKWEKNYPADMALEAFSEFAIHKRIQDEYANELIDAGVKPESVKKILTRDIDESELTEGERSIRNKFMKKYFAKESVEDIEKALEEGLEVDSQGNILAPVDRNKPILIKHEDGREPSAEGGEMAMPPELMEQDVPVDTYPNMTPEEEAMPIASDEQMQEDYVDYVTAEVLTQDEQDYLNAALDNDPQLEGILDKVVTYATEFTGEGEVEGPGTGISDSIPARLSDGEFVITEKATNEIGADNLQTMMDEAERAADGGKVAYALGGAVENPIIGGSVKPLTPETPLADEKVNIYGNLRQQEELKKQMMYANRMPSIIGR